MQLPCLSVHQPWGWAIAVGIKHIENRTWIAHHRGPMLLHAALPISGKAKALREYEDAKAYIEERIPKTSELRVPFFDDLVRGGIIGATRLDAIHLKRPSVSEWHIAGYYSWQLVDFVPLPFRKLRGNQRIFHVELTDTEAKLLRKGGLL